MKTVEQLYNERKAAVQAMQLASNAAPEMEEKLRIAGRGAYGLPRRPPGGLYGGNGMIDPIVQKLVEVEVNEASRGLYQAAHSLETLADFVPIPVDKVPGTQGALRRRARKLREIADNLTEGVAEAWKTE
jgi:hypothetical protein